MMRTIVHLQRLTLVLLILNAVALGICLTAWAIVAWQASHPPSL